MLTVVIYHLKNECSDSNYSQFGLNSRHPTNVEKAIETGETTELDEEPLVTFALCARSEQTNISNLRLLRNSGFSMRRSTMELSILVVQCVCGAV